MSILSLGTVRLNPGLNQLPLSNDVPIRYNLLSIKRPSIETSTYPIHGEADDPLVERRPLASYLIN